MNSMSKFSDFVLHNSYKVTDFLSDASDSEKIGYATLIGAGVGLVVSVGTAYGYWRSGIAPGYRPFERLYGGIKKKFSCKK